MTRQINSKKEFIILSKNGNTKVISIKKDWDQMVYIDSLMVIFLMELFIKIVKKIHLKMEH